MTISFEVCAEYAHRLSRKRRGGYSAGLHGLLVPGGVPQVISTSIGGKCRLLQVSGCERKGPLER